jgi:hypothetical protein
VSIGERWMDRRGHRGQDGRRIKGHRPPWSDVRNVVLS